MLGLTLYASQRAHIIFHCQLHERLNSGVLVLSLPIPIIAGNFEDFHRMQQTKTKAEKAKKKLTEAKANEEAERVAFCKAEVTME